MPDISLNRQRKLEVCFSPALLPLYQISESIVVVIDVLRATSSICYGIENGAVEIIPVGSIDECKSFSNNGHLLAAERDGAVVNGFHFGNSPFHYTRDKVEGRKIVLTTTNGTQAIRQCANAYKVVIGSFLNLSSLCNWLSEQEQDVLLLCSGWKNKFNLEDTLFAGAMVNRLKGQYGSLCDASIAAENMYISAKDDMREFLRRSSHSQRLAHLHIEADILFCLQEDQTISIPVLDGNRIVRLQPEEVKVFG